MFIFACLDRGLRAKRAATRSVKWLFGRANLEVVQERSQPFECGVVRVFQQEITSQARQSGARAVEMLGGRLQHSPSISDRLFDDLINFIQTFQLRQAYLTGIYGASAAPIT